MARLFKIKVFILLWGLAVVYGATAAPRIRYTERFDRRSEMAGEATLFTEADSTDGRTLPPPSAHRVSRFNTVHFEGPFTLYGDWDLRELRERDPWGRALRWIYDRQGLRADQFGSFFLKIPGTESAETYLLDSTGRPKAHHDLWYPLGRDDNGASLFGIKILPISNRRDGGTAFDAYPPITPVPDLRTENSSVPVAGSTELDNALARYYYRAENNEGIPYYDEAHRPSLVGAEVPRRTPILSAEIEAELRLEAELDEKYPLLAIMGYTRPNKWVGSLAQLGSIELLKTQGGFEHMGAYRGFGRQLDSPVDLYLGALGVMGEPAIAYGLRLKKSKPSDGFEESALVNKNILISLLLINKSKGGVIFPTRPDFTRDYLKAVNLREIFSFYRGWLDSRWVREDILEENEKVELARLRREGQDIPDRFTFYFKLRNDEIWFNYCSEYVTLAYNIGLNLIHNLEAYQEVYGPRVGQELFAIAKEEYRKITGRDLPLLSKKAFRPLYADVINLNRDRAVPVIERSESLELNQGLIWPMQTLSDLIKSFVASYARWIDLGAERSALVLLSFADEFVQRSEAPLEVFLAYAVAVATSAFYFESVDESIARASDLDLRRELQNKWARLRVALEHAGLRSFTAATADESLLTGEINRTIERYAASDSYQKLFKNYRESLKKLYPEAKKRARERLYAAFEKDIGAYVKEARRRAPEASGVAFYSLPALPQQILNGQHEINQRVELAVIGTVMHATEVQKVRAPLRTPEGDVFFQRDSQAGL